MSEPVDQLPPETFSGDLTVSELTGKLKNLLEWMVPVVSVVGELSNYTLHASGHRYFTLKDDTSQLRCVMFKWQTGRLDFEPKEGMLIRAVGNVTVYERGGQYQLTVFRLQPLGRGELFLKFEELKKRLAEEGLFAQKRLLPKYPSTVGVVTSPTGAAVRDIISVITSRAPHVRIILRPTLVQGASAADDIVNAIRDMNNFGNIDVLIVGRGGGSMEDLWCFNEEPVVRAIYGSRIPTVSAVGHETDFTLSDFAADFRAPTPSAAAEIVVRAQAELEQKLETCSGSLRRGLLETAGRLEQRLEHLQSAISPVKFLREVMMRSQQVDEIALKLNYLFDHLMAGLEQNIYGLRGRLAAMDPREVLKRGYAIVSADTDSRILTDAAMVAAGDRVGVELARGRLKAIVMSNE